MRKILQGLPLAGTLTATFVAGALLTSCADENPWGNDSDSTGKIHLSIETDGDVATAKPVFRSGEDGFQVSDYLTIPTPGNFKIKLEKKGGSYSATFGSIDALNNSNEEFSAGAYTLTAYYGEKGTQGFDCAYFEGSTDFTVLSDRTTNVDLTASLMNSMVVLEYTQQFKDYMSAWDATIYTEGVTGGINYSRNETKAAFVEPKEISIALAFTTNEGKSTTVDVGGKFAPLAKTLYHVTIDVKAKETGTPAITVTFDDSLEEKDVEIDLTDELFTTPAPTIETVGFVNGETVDMLEGTASDVTLKMNVVAKAGLEHAYLTINSDNYTASWGNEIDLCTATEAQQTQLTNAGISAVGFFKNPDKLAFLDLTAFGKSLPKGTHTIQLRVEDKNGATSEAASVVLDSQDITIEAVGQYILYGSNEATMTLDYNGTEPERNITFQAINEAGMMKPVTIKKCEEVTGTRAFETKTYIFTLELPLSTRDKITIDALHKGNVIGTFEVPVTMPTYTVEADAYANTVDIKVSSDNTAVEAAIVNNLKARIQGQTAELTAKARNTGTGIVTFGGLAPNTSYTLETYLEYETDPHTVSFDTEEELGVPNFSKDPNASPLTSGNLQVGGGFKGVATYYNHSSFSRNVPKSWATINAKTTYSTTKNQNTWFRVPSAWVEDDGTVTVRSVSYDYEGKSIIVSSSYDGYYCRNAPDSFDFTSAGEVFLGEYSYTGVESRKDGVSFASRPSSISFQYQYTECTGKSDQAFAYISILDSDKKSIASNSVNLNSNSNFSQVNLNLEYKTFQKEPKYIYISFKSSASANPPIYKPTGDALKETEQGGNITNLKTISANNYHALATGSVLKIKNVTAHYDRFPSEGNSPRNKKTSNAKK